MVDFETGVEPLVAWERLLKPVLGQSPSGVSLRNTPAYDEIPRLLRPQEPRPGGVGARDVKKPDYRALIRTASDLLATQSKDLDIAVWLAEALVGEHRLAGLSEGLLLIDQLLESFWDTIFPALDEGDEGFRAKPLKRLNSAFTGILPHLPITFDGRTVFEYNASADVPLPLNAEKNPELLKKRKRALEDGVVPPEEIARSVKDTSAQFYEEMAAEVRQARDAANRLQRTCNERFKTSDRPTLNELLIQLERIRVTVEAVQAAKPAAPPPLTPPERLPSPSAVPDASSKPAISAAPPLQPAEAAPAEQVVVPVPRSVFQIAAELRSNDPASPVSYMLTRSWQFGPMIERGAVDEDTLQPPDTVLRTALRRALLSSDWSEVLAQTEKAMEAPCGSCWLDLQHYSARACSELGSEGAAHAIRGMTAAYLRAVPDLAHAVMLDGSPTTAPDTQAWIRTEVLANPEKDRAESLEEARLAEPEPLGIAGEPDPFDVAANELSAGRFSEAFRILAEASAREASERGRIQRRIQLAKICMEGGQIRIAQAFLQEIFRVIEDRHLETWEAPDFVGIPLAMLYQCFEQLNENEEQRWRIYDKLCAVDPARALQLVVQP